MAALKALLTVLKRAVSSSMKVIAHHRLHTTTLRSACMSRLLIGESSPNRSEWQQSNAVRGDHVLVYFDGWSHNFDYWCCHDSPEIQPSGTCQRIGLKLQPPCWANGCNSTWDQSGRTMQGYVGALGVTLAPESAFSLPICSETGQPFLSLSERCVRRSLGALSLKALVDLGSGRSKLSTTLPFRVQQQLASARACVWCGGPFSTGLQVRRCYHLPDLAFIFGGDVGANGNNMQSKVC